MNISSTSTYSSALFEAKEHPAGCQCPDCCKKADNTSLDVNKDVQDLTKTGEGDESSIVNRDQAQTDAALSPSEQQQLAQLQQRDTEVRSHEAAHIAAGGPAISGGASFTYQKGPDGRLYAVGGEVPISSSGANTPEEKIALAKSMQAGALAPANPSPQDLKVASEAALMETKARQELALEKNEEQKEKDLNIYQSNQAHNNALDTSVLRLHA